MTHVDIDSPANQRVKAWRSLRKRRDRDATGLFLIEGERETLRAASQLDVVEVILREDREDVPLVGATIVSDRVFAAVSARQHPDGVAAIVQTPSMSLSGLSQNDARLVLVADGVEKPGNVGAMIRTCDAMGATFIGSSLRTDLVNPNVIRSAQGSLFLTPVADGHRSEVIAWCTDNTEVIVASPDGDTSLWSCDLTDSTTIVVGAEDTGVHSDWNGAGRSVSFPITGTADSFNTSTTAAIFLAEALRQRTA
ncbi:MAG: TrmH family RNA methyltransferase [Acidimicrobiia bacterium]